MYIEPSVLHRHKLACYVSRLVLSLATWQAVFGHKKINRRYTGIETLAKGKRVSLESLMPIIPIFTVT